MGFFVDSTPVRFGSIIVISLSNLQYGKRENLISSFGAFAASYGLLATQT